MTATAIREVGRFLAGFGHAQPRAAGMLGRCLKSLEAGSWPDIAWSFSGLNTDGCPIECGFSTHEETFRISLEVAGPDYPEHARLDAALTLLSALGLPRPEPGLVELWRGLQAGAHLKWGCWLGLRGSATGMRGKLYLELPGRAPVCLSDSRLHMTGFDPGQGWEEAYCILRSPTEARLRHILRDSPAAGREAVLDAIGQLTGMPLRLALTWTEIGASIARSGNDAPRAAIFFRARALPGGAAALRPHFMHRANYRALLGECPVAALPDHGVVSLIPHETGAELRVGISAIALGRFWSGYAGRCDEQPAAA